MDRCPNCGVAIFEDAESVGAHPVQNWEYVEGGERYCTACAFRAPNGEYELNGERIALSSRGDFDDKEAVEVLAENFSVKQLRPWLRAFDVSRPRGSSKRQSIEAALEQNRHLVRSEAIKQSRKLHGHAYDVMCGCGLETQRYEKTDAVQLAKEHSIKEMDCNATVWRTDGVKEYGYR